jgi:hypothetical protein
MGCSGQQIRVKQIANPEYPRQARFLNIQGTVEVTVAIGPDGKVLYATGSGANAALVEAAEQNAAQWVFGPFPAVAEFPLRHAITYVYTLEGHPVFIGTRPTVRTHLPDRIEIIAIPMKSDYADEKESSESNQQRQ